MDPEIVREIARLRRQVAVLRMFCLAVLIAVGALAVSDSTAAKSGIPNEIVARNVRVVGSDGKNSVELSATSDGFAGLFLRDLKGSLRGGILMTPSGKVSFDVSDGHASRVSVGVRTEEGREDYTLTLLDHDGKVLWRPEVSNPTGD